MRYVLVLVLAIPSTARADWPEANPARPSFSDNASTTAVGAFEVEAGVTSDDKGDTGSAQYTFKYGITDRFDARLNLTHGVWGGATSRTRLGLLLKYTVRKPDDENLGIAVEPYVNFPALSGGPEGFGGGAFLVGTYRRGGLQLDSCLVLDVDTAEMQDTAVTITPIAALSFPIAGELGGYVEGAVDIAGSGPGATNPFAGAGLAYALKPFLVFDAAFYVGDDPRIQVFAGLTFSIYVPPRRGHAPG